MFATFEGPEGAGKSTLIAGLAKALRAKGLEVVVTREPGAGEVGSAIRRILLHGSDFSSTSELFLFLADRANNVASVVRPALLRGAWVLCDRYADSTIVYQGFGRGLDLETLRTLNAIATGGLDPDRTFLLDLDPEIGLERIKSKDRLDHEPLAFHRKIREGFLIEARREPDRWSILDGSASADELLRLALADLERRPPANRT